MRDDGPAKAILKKFLIIDIVIIMFQNPREPKRKAKLIFRHFPIIIFVLGKQCICLHDNWRPIIMVCNRYGLIVLIFNKALSPALR